MFNKKISIVRIIVLFIVGNMAILTYLVYEWDRRDNRERIRLLNEKNTRVKKDNISDNFAKAQLKSKPEEIYTTPIPSYIEYDESNTAEERLNIFYENTSKKAKRFDNIARATFLFKSLFKKGDPVEIIEQALMHLDEIVTSTINFLDINFIYGSYKDKVDIDKLIVFADVKEIEEFVKFYLNEIENSMKDGREFQWVEIYGKAEIMSRRKNKAKETGLEWKMIKCGLITETVEGFESIIELPFYRYIILKEILDDEIKDFMFLKDNEGKKQIMVDGGLLVDDYYVFDLFHNRDNFRKKYPNSKYIDNIKQWDKWFLEIWLIGTDNYNIFTYNGKIRSSFLETLNKFVSIYPDSCYTPFFKSYLTFIDKKKYKPTRDELGEFFRKSQELN